MNKTEAAKILADHVKVTLVRRELGPTAATVAAVLDEGANVTKGSLLDQAFDANPSNRTVLTRVRQIWSPSWM